MKWRRGTSTENVEDIRGSSSSGSMGGLPISLGKGGGLMGLIILAAVFLLPKLLGGGSGGGFSIPGMEDINNLPQVTNNEAVPSAPGDDSTPDPDAELKDFSTFVFNNVQEFWAKSFSSSKRSYDEAKLVLFTNGVQTGCGGASSDSGPFYCPPDQKVYIDLGFYRELAQRFGAPGDFAEAYVIAHEMGHHVQTELGIETEVRRMQQQNPSKANDLSVRMELQADCLAGVWAHSIPDLLEAGDVDEGLNAAAAVGDDRIQRQATGRVNPETWTHGSSESRQKWFKRGYDSGDTNQCDTFSVGKV